MHVTLENAFFIIGPSMRVISKDDSYLKENDSELLEPYDEHNAFNIFTNNLKLRKKVRPAANETTTTSQEQASKDKTESEGKQNKQYP